MSVWFCIERGNWKRSVKKEIKTQYIIGGKNELLIQNDIYLDDGVVFPEHAFLEVKSGVWSVTLGDISKPLELCYVRLPEGEENTGDAAPKEPNLLTDYTLTGALKRLIEDRNSAKEGNGGVFYALDKSGGKWSINFASFAGHNISDDLTKYDVKSKCSWTIRNGDNQVGTLLLPKGKKLNLENLQEVTRYPREINEGDGIKVGRYMVRFSLKEPSDCAVVDGTVDFSKDKDVLISLGWYKAFGTWIQSLPKYSEEKAEKVKELFEAFQSGKEKSTFFRFIIRGLQENTSKDDSISAKLGEFETFKFEGGVDWLHDLKQDDLSRAYMPGWLKLESAIKADALFWSDISVGDGRLRYICRDPLDLDLKSWLQRRTGVQKVEAAGLPDKDFENAVEHLQKEDVNRPIDWRDASSEGVDQVVDVVNGMIGDAIQEGASDVHLEPRDRTLSVRFRIDGDLFRRTYSIEQVAKVMNRLKVMSGMDLTETRQPQDGRFTFRQRGRKVDVRASVVRTKEGEKFVLRLLGQGGVTQLTGLQLFEEPRKALEKALQRSHGLVLVCGPTGSGKTTTLYACLNRLKSDQLNLMTIEDPVEYDLPGVQQIQVAPKIGVTFATGLRSILRQDPDVIMVGEIRDEETAGTAVQAALTGHLVLATLHANTPWGAVNRMKNLKVEPFLLADVLLYSGGQRLLKKLCPYCRLAMREKEFKVYLEENKLDSSFVTNFMKNAKCDGYFLPSKCERCNHKGYLGRLPLLDWVEIGSVERKRILGDADATQEDDDIFKYWRPQVLRSVEKGDIAASDVLQILGQGVTQNG